MEYSSILESIGRLEISLKLPKLSVSRPGFFRIDVIMASLGGGGTELLVWEVFMMLVMDGMRDGRQALVREDGMGPRWQVVNFMVERSLETSDGDRGKKDEKSSLLSVMTLR